MENTTAFPVTQAMEPQPVIEVKNDVMSPESARLMRIATYAAVSIATVLVVAKLVAWMATESVSLLSTLIDSLLDVAASAVNLLAVRHALEPADREHRFGHGKAESLAGLAQSAFITGSAVFLFIEASDRFFKPRDIENTDIGFFVMGMSILLTLVLVGFQRYVVKHTRSTAIKADSVHYQMDVLVNLGVIVSLVLVSHVGWQWADPAIAVLIAVYIVRGAWEIARDSLDVLMDRELCDEDRMKIRKLALAHEDVQGVHDMRTRSSGQQIFIQLHLELDGDMSLLRTHTIADAVEADILSAFPSAEVIIHQDPEGIDEEIPVFR